MRDDGSDQSQDEQEVERRGCGSGASRAEHAA
jgi:hypothetical protein